MTVCVGSKRIVLVTSFAVFKLPKFRLGELKRDLWPKIRSRDWGFIKQYAEMSVFSSKGLATCLFGWLPENRTEYLAAKKFPQVFVPVWFSLFGIVNVQPLVSSCDLRPDQLLAMVMSAMENGLVDSHTFGNPENYGIYQGTLLLRDGGSQRLLAFLSQDCAHVAFVRSLLDQLVIS